LLLCPVKHQPIVIGLEVAPVDCDKLSAYAQHRTDIDDHFGDFAVPCRE
jgi:hypothetical protein